MFNESDFLFLDTEPAQQLQQSGAYGRKVCVVLPEADLGSGRAFLEKMMAAAKLDLEKDTLLLRFSGSGKVNLSALLRAKQAERVLVFGLDPSQLCYNLQAPLYQLLVFQEVQFIFADRLPVLEPDKDRKGKLWTAMKVMFGV